MHKNSLIFVGFLLTLLGPAEARAEERYAPFPLSGDPDLLFHKQLAQAEKQRFQQALSGIPLANLILPHLDIDYSQFAGMQSPKTPFGNQDWQKELAKMMQQMLSAPKSSEVVPQDFLSRFLPKLDPGQFNDQAFMRRLAESVLNKTEDENFAQLLRQSPAIQNSVADLKRLAQAGSSWATPETAHVPVIPGVPSAWTKSLGERLMSHLSKLKLPNGTKLKIPDFAPGAPSPGGVNLLPLPRRWNLPEVRVDSTVLWALLIAVVALLAGRVAMRTRPAKTLVRSIPPLNSWPVDPNRITTRAELRQAFDFLALFVLGQEIRHWNHRAVAEALTRWRPDQVPLVNELAPLYELARYAQGEELLSPESQQSARRTLVALAGVSS